MDTAVVGISASKFSPSEDANRSGARAEVTFYSFINAICKTIDYGCGENPEMTVTASNLEMHVRKLAAEIGERNVFRFSKLAEAAEYIQKVWSDQGYEVVPQSYDTNGIPCLNLEVTRWGQSRREQIILVGAHYDSVAGSPGADDNASGVAAMLEISRHFASVTTGRSVRFVAFANEEPPFFHRKEMGSMIYAHAARKQGDDIRLMVSLEMLGYYDRRPKSQRYPPLFRFFYPDRADFIAFVSNLRSRRQSRRAAAWFRSQSDFPLEYVAASGIVPGVAWSDHSSFWRQGYRAFMVTDTAFYRYPYYHTPWDVPDRLDYDSLACVTRGLCATITALADESANP